jgi:hypothetical protein
VDEDTKALFTEVIERVFITIKKKTGEFGISEEDFLKLTSNGLGPEPVGRRMFHVSCKDLSQQLSREDSGSRMRCLRTKSFPNHCCSPEIRFNRRKVEVYVHTLRI